MDDWCSLSVIACSLINVINSDHCGGEMKLLALSMRITLRNETGLSEEGLNNFIEGIEKFGHDECSVSEAFASCYFIENFITKKIVPNIKSPNLKECLLQLKKGFVFRIVLTGLLLSFNC